MLVLNTFTILIQVAFIVFMTLLSMNILRYLTGSVKNMVAIAPALFVNHGGGPMPLLGDKESIGLTKFLRDEVKKYVNLKELKAIILVTAHWEENKVTISSSEHHDLYFDYYGFPPETYKYSVKNMVAIAPALFVNHGGGPLPLLGGKESIGLTNFLRDEVKKYVNLKEFKAIIFVTAHWEENKATISSSEHHDLYFDYYGFPPETYKYRYDAPGDPELAKRIQAALTKADIDSKLDPKRGWDHGVFVPMMLINPDADIPIIQVSVLSNQDPEEHYRIGQVLYQFRKEGIAIFGSGMSYHNMREFRFNRHSGKVVNEDFDAFLHRACTSSDEKRRELLTVWESQPGAAEAHPPRAAEHLMPLIVIAGAGGAGPAERVFNWDLAGSFRLSGFIWKNE